jgi:colanic acid biosynthesis glycosyl transferase WcaI
MRILLHDFAGHPFQADLSRELARRGHDVDHVYFAGDIGPKGDLVRKDSDPETLNFTALGGGISYSKSDFMRRRRGDVAYGQALASHVRHQKPDIVICGNAPTDVISPLPRATRAAGSAFVYWVQDFNGLAAKRLLTGRFAGIGSLVGNYYVWLDKRHLRGADHVVVLTPDFCRMTDAWGVAAKNVTVIPNWGAINNIGLLDRDGPWAAYQSLGKGPRFLYSGTLALKHNPALLAALAHAVNGQGEVILVAAGVGADQLREQRGDFPALRCFPLQPFSVFEQVLASADVLLAMIERDAGTFSVPSKILSYLCAGRPVVLAAPKDNLAARIILESGAGTVVEPEDMAGFVCAALHYANDPEAAARAGVAGRVYAEENFRISEVADRFESVLVKAQNTRLGKTRFG